jgi:oxaloacetate decarboxylase gamma subunit
LIINDNFYRISILFAYFGGIMTIVEMLGQSGVLTLLGMGVVFGFLVIMVITINLAGKVVHALGLDKDTAASAVGVKTGSAVPADTGNKAQVTAAVSAAVNEYRKSN